MDRFADVEEDSECVESERCLLRLLGTSVGVDEGEEVEEGGLSIACVSFVKVKGKKLLWRRIDCMYTPR